MLINCKLSLRNAFVKRLDFVMSAERISSNTQVRAKLLADLCGLSPQAARKWLQAKSFPDIENLMKISARFSVTTSYLIGETNDYNLVVSDLKNAEFKGVTEKGTISVEITEHMQNGQLQAGDIAICQPTNDISDQNAIYMLQSSDKRYFRRLTLTPENYLVMEHEENGQTLREVYKDKQMIELFKSLIIGQVLGVIRPVK